MYAAYLWLPRALRRWDSEGHLLNEPSLSRSRAFPARQTTLPALRPPVSSALRPQSSTQPERGVATRGGAFRRQCGTVACEKANCMAHVCFAHTQASWWPSSLLQVAQLQRAYCIRGILKQCQVQPMSVGPLYQS